MFGFSLESNYIYLQVSSCVLQRVQPHPFLDGLFILS